MQRIIRTEFVHIVLKQTSNQRQFQQQGAGINLENVVTPRWLQIGMPLVTWRKKANAQKKVYLTFDDGPTAEFTGQLLDVLRQYDAKATFFCLGENVEKNRDQFATIVDGGHLVGNHSHSHPNGWKTATKPYVADVLHCQDVLSDAIGCAPKYFRPPYGRISLKQLFQLRRSFEVVLWDILSMDYRHELTGQQVARNVTENVKPGSIVLLHDSELAAERVTVALPMILEHLTENGFQMCTLDQC